MDFFGGGAHLPGLVSGGEWSDDAESAPEALEVRINSEKFAEMLGSSEDSVMEVPESLRSLRSLETKSPTIDEELYEMLF